MICQSSVQTAAYRVIGRDLHNRILLDGDVLAIDQISGTDLGALGIQHHSNLPIKLRPLPVRAFQDAASEPPSGYHGLFRETTHQGPLPQVPRAFREKS